MSPRLPARTQSQTNGARARRTARRNMSQPCSLKSHRLRRRAGMASDANVRCEGRQVFRTSAASTKWPVGARMRFIPSTSGSNEERFAFELVWGKPLTHSHGTGPAYTPRPTWVAHSHTSSRFYLRLDTNVAFKHHVPHRSSLKGPRRVHHAKAPASICLITRVYHFPA